MTGIYGLYIHGRRDKRHDQSSTIVIGSRFPVSYTHLDVYKRQLFFRIADVALCAANFKKRKITGEGSPRFFFEKMAQVSIGLSLIHI